MKVGDTQYRSIWLGADGRTVQIIDQTRLPHDLVVLDLATIDQAARAIRDMWVRGAPLIGATAAYGMALQMAEDPSDAGLVRGYDTLYATRPTAVNLRWALEEMRRILTPLPVADRAPAAYARAAEICDEDVEINRRIGAHGVGIIEEIAARKSGPVNILPAAKNFGASRLALASARMHPTEFLAGEIAGSLAAFCLEKDLRDPAPSTTPPRFCPSSKHDSRRKA